MTIETYQCPQCSAPLIWKNGELVCESCGASYKEEDMRALSEAMQENAGQSSLDWNKCRNAQTFTAQDESALQEYNCPACGAVLVTSAATAATKCAYCGNNALIPKQFSGELRPDAILPFTVSREDAEKKLREHFHGKKLLPDDFVRACRVEDVEGLYVPYFLFNCQADARCTYRAERVNTYRRGDWQITDTLHFYVERCGRVSFDRVPVDGSSKMPDDLMESIEPFKFEDAVDFKTAYLAGYLADKYDVTAEQSIDRANERIKRSTEDAFASTVKGYHSVTTENSSIRLHNGKAKYALYPVWLLNTTWKGKKYLFAMNGQTGKFVGDLPVDNGLYFKWLGGLTAGFGVIALIAYFLFWLF